MVDFDPTDHTAHTAQPAYEADFRPMFRDPDEVPQTFAAWSPITMSNKTVMEQPAASLSADEIKAMRKKHLHLCGYAMDDVLRILDALEALTAERDEQASVIAALRSELTKACDAGMRQMEVARELRAERDRLADEAEQVKAALADPQAVHLGMLSGGIAKPSLRNMLHLNGGNALKIWDEAVEFRIELASVQAERDSLKAEVERLAANVIDLSDQLKLDETYRIMREIEDEDELRRLCARDDDEGSPLDHDWYASHRRRVEAAHAAAKQTKREAECRNCRDGFPAYISPADWDTCPDCGKQFAAAKEGVE